jgi:small subunit ribosomal protein S1
MMATNDSGNPFGSDNNDSGDSSDFDELEKKPSSDEFARMLEASFKAPSSKKRLSVGDKVRGEILVLGKEEVYVTTGTQNDGVVSRRDLKDLEDEKGNLPFKTGDTIELFVTQVRGTEIRLSPKPTSKNLADDIEDAFDMMLPLEGKVAEVVNGGFRVSIKGKLAFCPISQMDNKRIEQPEEYIGKKFEFRVTKFEEGGRNIVVSRRKLLDEERDLNLGNFAAEHKSGDIVPGKVSRLEKFGAFVELAPGLDGLAHISELAWSRIADPAEVLQVGQEVNVKILKIESVVPEGSRTGDAKLRISLSVKQAGERPEMPDPWAQIAEKYPVGTIVSGKVERREPYGLFVRISDNLTGLLPKSKTVDRPEFPFDKLRVGDVATVQIAEVRRDERRISLEPPKDPHADDWKGYVAQPAAEGAGTGFGTLADKLKAAMGQAPQQQPKAAAGGKKK